MGRTPTTPRAAEPRLGAYGYWLPDLAGASAWLQPVAETAPALSVVVEVGPAGDGPPALDSDRADLRLLGGGRLVAERGSGSVRYLLPARPPDADLVHPYLAAGAGLAWRWSGREALHAGAVEAGGGAVLLIGAKEAGKSTTLAWLATAAGVGILADDLAVLEGDRVHAGPRTIDLRDGAQELAGAVPGPNVQAVRGDERARLTLPPVPPALPVAGVAVLEWGPACTVTPVPLGDRWAVLASQRMFPQLATDGESVLALVGVPMIRFTRPQGEASLAATGEALLDAFR